MFNYFGKDKIKVVEKVGFSGLIKLKIQNLKVKLIEDLVLRFDAASCKLNFHGEELKITINDMVWTLVYHLVVLK